MDNNSTISGVDTLVLGRVYSKSAHGGCLSTPKSEYIAALRGKHGRSEALSWNDDFGSVLSGSVIPNPNLISFFRWKMSVKKKIVPTSS